MAAPAALVQNPAMPTPPEIASRLVLITFNHWNMQGELQDGEIILYDEVAPEFIKVIEKAYEIRFPFHRFALMCKFRWDDHEACRQNISAGHNMRLFALEGASKISKHGTGTAWDINPLQNPCWDIYPDNRTIIHSIYPDNATGYNPMLPGTLYLGHPLVQMALEMNYAWGGLWKDPLDLMHFQKALPQHQKYFK
jgi:hypothetical protein